MSMNSPLSSLDDPWDWSVDQIIGEFCRLGQDRPTWCSPTDPLPDPKLLEQSLRENDVTGELMLTAFTKEVLRDDLGIKSMGQRHTIVKGVHYLRSRSQKFQISPANVATVAQLTPVYSWLQASAPPYDHPSNIAGSVQSAVPGQALNSPRLDLQPENSGLLHLQSSNSHGIPQILAPDGSSKETAHTEAARNVIADSAPPAIIDRNLTASLQHETAVKVRRRVAPIFVSHLDDSPRDSAPVFGEHDTNWDESVKKDIVEREFAITGAHVTNGQQIHAARAIKKYLTQFNTDPLGIRQSSSRTHIVQHNNANFTALQERQREHIEDAELRYLLDKYPAKLDDEDVLPTYGDSGEEGNFDEATWYEIQNDAVEDIRIGRSDRALPLTVVNSTIDKCIEDLETTWQETRLTTAQAKGFRLWKKANREGRLRDEYVTAQYWIKRLQQSIVKIRQAITRESWSKVEAVRRQCQSLEESIFQQQLHQYNVSILGKPSPPARPDRESLKRQNPQPIDLAEGEIFLDSESEASLSNFVDNDETEQIPTMRSKDTNGFAPVQDSDDSEDVISPFMKRRNNKPPIPRVDPRKNPFIDTDTLSSAEGQSSEADSDLDHSAPLPESRFEKVGHERGIPIDLISSSDPPTPANIRTSDNGAKLNNGGDLPPTTPTRSKIALHMGKTLDDIEGIKEMDWDVIENTSDSRRALAKAIYSLSPREAIRVRNFVKDFAGEEFQQLLQQGFRAILNRHSDVHGIDKSDWDTARMTTLLFTSYCLARKVLDESHLHKDRTIKAQGMVDRGAVQFLKELRRVFSHYPKEQVAKRAKRELSDAESRQIESVASDSEAAIRQLSSGKKRRRVVKENQIAASQQKAGLRRQQEAEQRTASMDQRFQNIPRNMMNPAGYAIGMDEPVIYLDPKIGGKVKAHQIKGIRFMWRELMTDENKQGCLLAHTMGLGKTMQVISLLATITQSAKSPEAGIRKQIPSDLRDLNALILCPPSLIDNWYEEILMWQPEPTTLGGLYKITQKTKAPDRVQDIAQWASDRGILIISYDMFRGLIVNKAASRKTGESRRPLSDADHAAVQEHLLNHPNIIIADEAHKMKNTEAGISLVTSRFKSTKRIALTGSPLANNLDEYFAMIDWIAPGYLGTKQQFRSKYANPISEGLWNDSETMDRRLSLRRLHVLKKNLDPKISRADITAIAGDLPPKVEFFITVPLTKLQVKAYNRYVTSLLGDDQSRSTGNARMWDWLAILSLLCNHPSTFLTKLEDRQYQYESEKPKVKAKALVSTDDVDGFGLPTDIELADAGLSPEMVEQQRKIFQDLEDSDRLEDPSMSHRCQIVCDIIKHSVVADDKVLLFSHSIPSLNYLEKCISSMGYSTCRLDGTTNMTERQDAVKNFNKETSTFNVFFISTRAGGLGLNLQGANRVILFDYGFNPIWEEQAVGRAYRLGQQKQVFVYRLRAAGTFEELIYNKAVFKTQLSARVVDKKNPMRFASRKATDYLFPVKDVPQEDLSPYHGKDPEVLDKILDKSNFIRDITLTETFQREEDESLTPEEVKQANDELKDEQEMRRGPVAYMKRRADLQNALLKTRVPVTIPSTLQPSPYGQTFPLRPPVPASQPDPQLRVKPSLIAQPAGYVSRPEAIRGPQQTESGFWDHWVPSSLQARLPPNILGLPPFRNISQNDYPSPTSEARPTEVKKAPGSPSQLGKQLDGAADSDDDDDDGGLERCKTQ